MIDGRIFLAGALADGASVEPVKAPWDDAVVGEVHRADARIVDAAIAAGTDAAPTMAKLASHERRAMLRRIAGLLHEHAAMLATLIEREAGKPIKLARAEVARAATTFDFAADAAGRFGEEALNLDAAPPGTGRYGIVRRFPAGLVAAISPFNFPLNLVAHKLAPAFAAGCPVVLKPASQTPLTALALAALCQQAGLPAGGLSVVPSGRRAADHLVTDPRVRVLSFTGSAEVGWDLKARAGKKRVVLELGGDAAVVVLDDADLTRAVERTAQGAFAYAGQTCISVQRVLVARARYRQFREALVEHTRLRVGVGDPAHDDTDCGPLIDDHNVARMVAWIAEARDGGARVLCGGALVDAVGGKRVLAPTLLEDVPAGCKLATDEAFGPIAVLEPIDDVGHAIARVNASRFGLQVGVFTDSTKALWRMLEGCQVGAVIHDDAPGFRVDHMPYGGVKDSGFGREGLPRSLEDYTEQRLLALRP